jgi:DNA-directed RNA polymerase specialized sigma24 family protein
MTYEDKILTYYDELVRRTNRLYFDKDETLDAVQNVYLKFSSPVVRERYKDCSLKELRYLLHTALRLGFIDYLRTKGRKVQSVDISVEEFVTVSSSTATDTQLIVEDVTYITKEQVLDGDSTFTRTWYEENMLIVCPAGGEGWYLTNFYGTTEEICACDSTTGAVRIILNL